MEGSLLDELAAVEWKSATVPHAEYDRIVSRYPKEHVADLLLCPDYLVDREEARRLHRSMFRAAVAVARIHAESGGWPASVEEAGLGSVVGYAVDVLKGRSIAQIVIAPRDRPELTWPIGRRTKN
jgi:hypothetical protein